MIQSTRRTVLKTKVTHASVFYFLARQESQRCLGEVLRHLFEYIVIRLKNIPDTL